jgi:hypothetical protein
MAQGTAKKDTTVTATDLDIRNLTNVDVVTAELSAVDNAVLDAIAASVAAIDTDTTTIIGHVDGIEGSLTTLNAKDFATQTTLAAINTKLVSGTDIGDVTINNAAGASAVNIQDGGNSITIDGSVSITGSVDTELPTAATIAADTVTPTVPGVASYNFIKTPGANTWDRIYSVVNATNSTGTGIVAVGNLAQFDDTTPTSITENQFGNLRMSANRNAYQTLRDAAGNERGLNITARNSALLEGPTASGVALAAAPVTGGGLAKTANPTAVTDGQVVNSTHDKLGKQVVVGSIRDLKGVQNTTITSSTSETTIVTAAASTFHDLYGLIITNTSSTDCEVAIKDSTGGTTRCTFKVPGNDTRGFMQHESASINQATVNNNWTATCVTSVASIKIAALFIKNT